MRLVGWEEIERWAARGAPLPRLPRVVRADSAAAVAEAPGAR